MSKIKTKTVPKDITREALTRMVKNMKPHEIIFVDMKDRNINVNVDEYKAK